jgi:MinD-like ATPase involved in chromosome partitioning or flagellar assembly
VTTRTTEVIAIASGKGGTGKTLVGACLGYALTFSGHRVLMIDSDTATHGLSLFLLGPRGRDTQPARRLSTWSAVLRSAAEQGSPRWSPTVIRRDLEGEVDHGVKYEALISELGIYGDEVTAELSAPLLRGDFQRAAGAFFEGLRSKGDFDYVLLDTRGGFSFESTDLCALADSFIVITDADLTSFVQDRNLVRRINTAAGELGTKPLLRAMIVNRADGDEKLFRVALEREFPVTYSQTHAIPLDLDALKAYKTLQSPYVVAPGSHFSSATLKAFAEIMSIVTAEWSDERVARWNQLAQKISVAVNERNARFEREQEELRRQREDYEAMLQQVKEQSERIAALERELKRSEAAHEREIQRVEILNRPSPMTLSSEAAPAPRPRRSQWLKITSIAAVVVGILSAVMVGYIAYTRYERQRADEMLVLLYKAETPPALRIKYLKLLYETGQRSFDKLDLAGLGLDHLRAREISLRGAKLIKTDLRSADLTMADLSGASAWGADLSGATLARANLQNTDLTGANMSHAVLTGADLSGARLDSANFKGAIVDPGAFPVMGTGVESMGTENMGTGTTPPPAR